jgi:hypothetical protein
MGKSNPLVDKVQRLDYRMFLDFGAGMWIVSRGTNSRESGIAV